MPETIEIIGIKAATKTRFGAVPDWGAYECRTIAGTDTPSQHAWGNAWDIGIAGVSNQQPVVSFLQTLPITGRILWAQNRPSDHSDHIHVEGIKERSGTPACMGGADEPEITDIWECEQRGEIWFCFGSESGVGRTFDTDQTGEPTGYRTGFDAGKDIVEDALAWLPKVLISVAGVGLLLVGAAFVVADLLGTDIAGIPKAAAKATKVVK